MVEEERERKELERQEIEGMPGLQGHVRREEHDRRAELKRQEDAHQERQEFMSIEYEKVSDQGPVWVRSEDKIPSAFISTHYINIWLLECSLVPKLSEYI